VTSYRFRRRSFLASHGGAFGLSTLLSNLEASAEGAGSPPGFLMLFWPGGTIPALFRPQGTGRSYTPSAILAGGPSFDQILLKHVPGLSRADAPLKLPSADLTSTFANKAFAQYASGPIPGLWSKPA
jgi:hypothetical protein